MLPQGFGHSGVVACVEGLLAQGFGHPVLEPLLDPLLLSIAIAFNGFTSSCPSLSKKLQQASNYYIGIKYIR